MTLVPPTRDWFDYAMGTDSPDKTNTVKAEIIIRTISLSVATGGYFLTGTIDADNPVKYSIKVGP